MIPRPRRRPSRAIRPGDPGYPKSVFDQACARRGMWSREGAAEIGISEGHLLRILNGNHRDHRQPTPDLARRIARFCRVSVPELFPDLPST